MPQGKLKGKTRVKKGEQYALPGYLVTAAENGGL